MGTNHKEVAMEWLSRPKEIVELETYGDLVIIHLTGFRVVEIGVVDDGLEYYTREGEDEK